MTSITKTKEKTGKLKYTDSLDYVSRERYIAKLKLIDGKDPYEVSNKEWSRERDNFPDITYPDIVNYLVYSKSAYTFEDFKAYKSLEAYNQFVCGWVTDVCHSVINCKHLLLAKVRHSQRMNDPPLKPWVIAEKCGTIDTAHCNCMAGLGEACSHVGALLFYVDAAVKIKNSKTVTEEPAYWKLPSGLQKVQYKPIKDINFQSAKAMKKTLEDNITTGNTPRRAGGIMLPDVPPPTEGQISTFLRKLHSNNTKSVILTVKEEFSNAYVPKCTEEAFPTLLSELYSEEYEKLSKDECLAKCEDIFASLCVTEEQCKFTEEETRDQSSNKTWHHIRTGRITASRMKSVCVTSIDNPSKSLVNAICHPTTIKFSTKATRWGCNHEESAREYYSKEMEKNHQNFKCEKSGLVLNPNFPHFGASPDAVVSSLHASEMKEMHP
ncbi:uncharacterized protein LOC134265178 [Saccostrea cucullata]|uniref:uncharacterized protein LOC134265178 n=1 Tax=Saccostrea cuccullata TaxID=36930 RepID=UPI002ECFDDC7